MISWEAHSILMPKIATKNPKTVTSKFFKTIEKRHLLNILFNFISNLKNNGQAPRGLRITVGTSF